MRRLPLAGLAATLFLAGQAAAQITPITVPKGKLRWDFTGQFQTWDWRWRDGAREEAAADLIRQTAGAGFLPGIAEAEARLERITGLSAVELSLGQSIASEIVNVGTRSIGGAVGLSKSITIFGRVPFVSVKIEPRFLLDTAASTLGVNPGAASYTSFLAGLNAANAALAARINAAGFDPNLRAQAQARLAYGQSLYAELLALLSDPATASGFLPLASSQVGALLLSQIQAYRDDLTTFGVTPFAGSLTLPSKRASRGDVNAYLADPSGPIGGGALDEIPYLLRPGDIEVGTAILLVDKFPKTRIGPGFRATVDATVRLRTGQVERQDRFLDLGTGDGQPDVDVNLTTDFAFGRGGIRLVGGYNLQLPGNQSRRVAPPSQPIAAVTTLAGVRRDPGDVIRLSARPFLRLATYLSVFGAADYWNRRVDKFSYAAGQTPIDGANLDDLAIGSKSDALLVSGGLSYSHAGESKGGIMGLPMDASVVYQRILRSRTGILPDASTVRIDLRFYSRLWN